MRVKAIAAAPIKTHTPTQGVLSDLLCGNLLSESTTLPNEKCVTGKSKVRFCYRTLKLGD